jgi:SAM-dependent methyltransferase
VSLELVGHGFLPLEGWIPGPLRVSASHGPDEIRPLHNGGTAGILRTPDERHDVQRVGANPNTPAYWDNVYRRECEGGRIEGGPRDYQVIHDAVVRLIEDGSRVLDVGCGIGVLCRKIKLRLPRATVLGVDFSRYVVAWNRERDATLGIEYVELDVRTELPEVRREFDAVLLCNVLEHLEEPHRVAADAIGLVRPGGLVVMVCPHDEDIPDPERLHRMGHDEVFHLLAPFAQRVTFTRFDPPFYDRWLMAHLTKEFPGNVTS